MKTNKKAFCLAVALGLMLVMPLCASAAADYSFQGVAATEYYQSTNYAEIYGAQFKYSGKNVAEYQIPELPYGVYSNTSIGVMDRAGTPSQMLSFGSLGIDAGGIPAAAAEVNGTKSTTYAGQSVIVAPAPATQTVTVYQKTAYTSTSDMVRSDGSIGTLKIPTLGINMKVWEGETDSSMSKGIAHYSSTTGWDGNIGLCGHNRGTKYAIGSIKDLRTGDTITYTTVYGTRTYTVSYVDTISSTDWSRLQATADNRITITTCLADQPSKRVVVQAIEK